MPGIVAHDDVIGRDEGSTVAGSTGRGFLVVRPTLADVVLKMPRGAQVIYPKDLGAILMAADIGPGQRVLEAGVGSGALSMALLRAGASVVGYELREDFADRARSNVAALLGPDADYRVEIARRDRGHRRGRPRPGPARSARALAGPAPVGRALRPGGILLAYLPTINQTAQLRGALEPKGPSVWPRPSRSCAGPGTSKPARSGPTTGWSPTPGSSPRPGACSEA